MMRISTAPLLVVALALTLALALATAGCSDDEPDTATGGGGSSAQSSSSGQGGDGGMMQNPNLLPAGCWDGAPPLCNPLTNASCTEDFACDLGTAGFTCFFGDNDAAAGQACNPSSGPYCMPGLHCYGAVCRAFCCADSDCGGNTCEPIQPQKGTIGVCPAP